MTDEYVALRDQIVSTLPEGTEPLFISICGSRAKDMASPGSDFDMKLIVKYPKNTYMLQKVKPTRELKTELNKIEVEGTCMDALLAFKYACECNPMLYECLAGIPILKTQASEELSVLWLEAYQWPRVRHSIAGMLMGYKMKKLSFDPANKDNTTYKLAGESIYLGLKLLFIQANPTEPPPFKIAELLQRTDVLLTD